MTRLEIKSERKRKAIQLLVEDGEYSIAYAMIYAEQLNDEGKLLDDDYDILLAWLEAKLEPAEPEQYEEEIIPDEVVAEDTNPIEYESEVE